MNVEQVRAVLESYERSTFRLTRDDIVDDVLESMLAVSRGQADSSAEIGRIVAEHGLDGELAEGWRRAALEALSAFSPGRLACVSAPPGTAGDAAAPDADRVGGAWVSRRRFEELVAEALDSLPPELGRKMENLAVVVEEQATGGDADRLLGLYRGVPLTARGATAAPPDRISIYRRPICRRCRSEWEVRDKVRQVVVHEVAHHFGIGDRRLHELGWG